MKQVDLVVEAALEKMELKKQIFADLEERTRPETLLATNTSALSDGDRPRLAPSSNAWPGSIFSIRCTA